MLALGYLHVTFPLKVRSHLANSELRHATNIRGNKRAFGFRETDIHSKVSITDGTHFTYNYVLLPIKEIKDCNAYPPAEPSAVKRKKMQLVME